eukprot:1365308-Amorphochlora_amoeboformis.AAC.1
MRQREREWEERERESKKEKLTIPGALARRDTLTRVAAKGWSESVGIGCYVKFNACPSKPSSEFQGFCHFIGIPGDSQGFVEMM